MILWAQVRYNGPLLEIGVAGMDYFDIDDTRVFLGRQMIVLSNRWAQYGAFGEYQLIYNDGDNTQELQCIGMVQSKMDIFFDLALTELITDDDFDMICKRQAIEMAVAHLSLASFVGSKDEVIEKLNKTLPVLFTHFKRLAQQQKDKILERAGMFFPTEGKR